MAPKPIMVECEECAGTGEHQARCEDCQTPLTTANQGVDDPDRCKACAGEERHEHVFKAMTADANRHPRRACACGALEVWRPRRGRKAGWDWRPAESDEERANVKPASGRAWWSETNSKGRRPGLYKKRTH